MPYVYITNGGGPHEEERAGLLQKELGVPVSVRLMCETGRSEERGAVRRLG